MSAEPVVADGRLFVASGNASLNSAHRIQPGFVTALGIPFTASVLSNFTGTEIIQPRLTVVFHAVASGGMLGSTGYNCTWFWGDSTSSTGCSTSGGTHTYFAKGTYSVYVDIWDLTRTQLTIPLTVWVNNVTGQPIASWMAALPCTSQQVCSLGKTLAFFAMPYNGIGPYTFSWQFGDGGTSTAQYPVHTYSNVKTYTVILTVTDSLSHQVIGTVLVTIS